MIHPLCRLLSRSANCIRSFATEADMKDKVPRLLLFDIDGTLTKSHYDDPDKAHPMALAVSQAFGKSMSRGKVKFAGGTDRSIIRALVGYYGITEENTPDYEKKVLETLRILPGFMSKGLSEGTHWWSALPNVHELLQRLSMMEDVQLGLLTGNIIEDARIKLGSASVNINLFEVDAEDGKKNLLGAFGTDHEIRSRLVQFAQRRYEQLVGKAIQPKDMVIIGDSSKDIECAHDNGVACVAVGTGPNSYEDLTEADYLLKDGFKDIEESIQAIITTQR